MLENSEIRRQVRLMIAESKRGGEERRARAESEVRVGKRLLRTVVVPMFKTVAEALKVEGYAFRISTPVDSVRISVEGSGENFIEMIFDSAHDQLALRGRVSRLRGRQVLVDERSISAGSELSFLEDEQVLEFLLAELQPFVD